MKIGLFVIRVVLFAGLAFDRPVHFDRWRTLPADPPWTE